MLDKDEMIALSWVTPKEPIDERINGADHDQTWREWLRDNAKLEQETIGVKLYHSSANSFYIVYNDNVGTVHARFRAKRAFEQLISLLRRQRMPSPQN